MKIADTFIRLKQVVMTSSGTCLFLGNDQKTFIIYVDPVMGEQIRLASSKQAPSRPLTFDFMRYLLFGLDVSIRPTILRFRDTHYGIGRSPQRCYSFKLGNRQVDRD